MQRKIRKIDDVQLENLKPENVSTATIVRLPFHLCTGALFQFVDPEQDQIEIWLRNKLSYPHDADIHEQLGVLSAGSSSDDYLTDALLVDRNPKFRSGEFEAIKNNNPAAVGCASPANPGFRLLNEIIAAHQMVRVGPYVAGMGAMWPRMLSEDREMFPRVIGEFVLAAKKERVLDESQVSGLFEQVDQLPLSLPEFGVGDLRDFTGEQLSSLVASVQRLRDHAFYELKTNALTAMLGGDPIVAIVLACAALEGAHGAFIRLELRDKIPGERKKFNSFMNSLLREQGFFSLVQLSSRVFMADDERPSEDDLEKCLKGVTIRNAIMHASIRGSGEYKLRELSRSEINEGYSGILAVYRAFESAVERRSEQEQ